MLKSCYIMDILMGEQMNYTLMPSLECGALIKIVITLWNQDDITDLIEKAEIITYRYRSHKEWLVLGENVEEKVQQLPLPESLKKKVLNFIKSIALEIIKWSKYHESFLSKTTYKRFVRESPNKLCWSSQGTVDRKKTADAFIKDESLDITDRYTLACIYCFENDISTLWNKMPEDCRRSYYFSIYNRFVIQQKLVLFWTYNVCGDVHQMRKLCGGKWYMCDIYQNIFEYAVISGNKVATEYFLQKLTFEKREESLGKSVVYNISSVRGNPSLEDFGDILCILLSQMTDEQRLEILRKYPYHGLRILLDWPRQGSFVEMAKHLCAFLSENNYYYLLEAIIDKVMNGYKDFNYQKLFREFWQQSPITHKKYVIHECASHSLLLDLFQEKDIGNIKLILEDATIADKEKVIFSKQGKYTCESLIYDDEMDSLEFFLRECIPSKDAMIKFGKEFEEHTIYIRSKETREKYKDRWFKFCQFFNDLIQTYD